MPQNRLPHIRIEGPSDSLLFASTTKGRSNNKIPPRNRQTHGEYLKGRLEASWQEAESEFVASHAERHGVYLEFRSTPGFDVVIKSLEDLVSKKIRLCNVRTENQTVLNLEIGVSEEKKVTFVTVFIANEKRQYFCQKIEQYLNEDTPIGRPKNANLVNGIEDLRKALLIDSFWQDDKNLIPAEEAQWCEVWLRDSDEVQTRFDKLLSQQKILSKKGCIKFPERIVKLVHVSRTQLESISKHSDDIAEYRKAKDTALFLIDLPIREQAQWVENLTKRLVVDSDSLIAVCILDTGVNYGHPLLSPLLNAKDCHAVKPNWGTDDHKGHGTLMAGLAAYGDLKSHLESSSAVQINHLLESVKILPRTEQNDPELWGDITAQGISKAEIQAPSRNRIISMAVTSEDSRDRGRPTSWSGALDQITAGVDDDQQRLFIVSTGNITDLNNIGNYPDAQTTDSVHDPAQSWNALSVGAYTQLTQITDPTLKGYKPIAKLNQLSPYTTTSLTWEDKWPIKPEVVFEGGNMVSVLNILVALLAQIKCR